ncbi:MAG: hypothetical protein K2J84_05780 [Bacteroidaceae bacterium]|nr:hypothetical protein [Bacteroidaceae bacterium]
MKRKFISVFLLSALMVASTGTFVSCNDYDDDISELRDAITANKSELATSIDEKLETANSQLTSLKNQADALDEAYKLADNVLQGTLQDAINQSQGTLQEGIGQAESKAKAYADIQAAEAEKAAVEAARKMVDEAVSSLEASIKAANEKIAAQGNSIEALIAADGELSKGIASAQARADEAYDLADRANKLAASVDAKADANAENVKKLQDALGTLTTNLADVQKSLDEKTDLINGKVSDLADKAEKQAASISSLETQLNSLRESNDAAIKALQNKDAELLKLIEDNNNAIKEQLNNEVKDLKTQAEENLKTAKAYTDAEILTVSNNINAIKGDIDGINVTIADMQEAYKKADKELAGKIDELKSDIEEQLATLKANQTEADKAQDQKIKDLEEQLAKLKADQTVTDEAQDQKIKDLEEQIATQKGDLTEAGKKIHDLEELLNSIKDGDLEAFAEKVKGMDEDIADLQGEVKKINDNITYLGKRLKSLVFAPTTYVDGIECIQFATLNYYNWGTNWERDTPEEIAANYVVIDDAAHAEEYLVNPKNVLKADIKALSFISNQATNTTRAVSEGAPISIANWDVAKGVMKLDIQKNVTSSFGTNRDKFTIVALKATLDDKFLTEEEIKNGEKAEVYSDWARLYETSVRPYIHNKLAKDNSGKLIEWNVTSHFWNYSDVYNGKTKATELPSQFNNLHIADEVYYKNEVDLLDYVEVCDKQGKIYDADAYGLGFVFNVMDYKLKNEYMTNDDTNQKHFAKLIDGHKLVSTARDNETMENRDAIGRQPMIQAVLMDTKNKKVVDVRYFKIKWIDKIDIKEYGELYSNTTPYVCSEDVSQTILEKAVNGIYTECDMSRDEFHRTYSLNSTLFASLDEAKKENGISDTRLGRINDMYDSFQDGQTHNIKWTISTATYPATTDEYKAGQKEIEAWGYFYDNINPKNRIVFSVKLTMPITKLAYTAGKDATMWKDDARFINPQLDTDGTYGIPAYATTQFVGDFLKGYIKNGQTPSTLEDLVNNADEARIVFDETKLNTLPGTKKWTISSDGQILSYDGVKAAIINGTDIQLYESNDGQEGSEPSEGAKLLVGKSAPVKLVDFYCNWMENIDSYNVNFIAPLAIEISNSALEVKDITAGGGSSASLASTIEVKEVYTTNKRVVWNNKPAPNTIVNDRLMGWYGFEVPEYSTADAKTNIQTNGSISGACTTSLNSIKNADGTRKYDVEIKDPNSPNAKVVFYNLSGNAIGQEFKIEIPVKVHTKWQDMSSSIVVTVKPNI